MTMMRDLRDTKTNRRKFLRDVAAAGGLAVAAGSTGAAVAAATASPKPQQKNRPTGYRVTAHVSKYYDKARI
jgi:nitrous oxide reductase